jgi:hypothetical protein
VTAAEVDYERSLTVGAAFALAAPANARARAAAAACAAAPAAGGRRGPPCCHGSGAGGASAAAAAFPAGVGGTCRVCAGAELAFVPGPERASAAAAGRHLRRWSILMGLWNPAAFLHNSIHHLESGHVCASNGDAPLEHWDATARASRLCRE